MKKLAIVTTHPIQYNAPLFRLLAQRNNIQIKVFYTWGESVLKDKFDPGFGKVVQWDIPLLEGYEYQFVKNVSKQPGSHSYKGIQSPDLVNQINLWQPDALMVYGWNFSAHLSCIRHFKNKIPVFFRGDSTLLDSKSFVVNILKNIILKWVYRHIDYALYVGVQNRNYFLHYGIKETRLIHSPHVVDNNHFNDSNGLYKQVASIWRKKMGIANEDIVFLYAGKLDQVKNIDFLIKVFKQLNETITNSHLIIVGDGILKDELVLLSQKTNLANPSSKITFLPFQNQSQMPIVYRLGDVYTLSSKSETWGLSVNEAMACGKAVLVSDKVGCAPDLVESGVNGFVFQSGNQADLLHKMKILCNDKQLVKKMGEASLNKISPFNQNSLAEIIEKSVLSMNIGMSKLD